MAACATASPDRDFKFLYDAKSQGIKSKIEAIVKGAYGGEGATYSEAAEARIAKYESDPKLRGLPICMSKTQYSLTDDASKLGVWLGVELGVGVRVGIGLGVGLGVAGPR